MKETAEDLQPKRAGIEVGQGNVAAPGGEKPQKIRPGIEARGHFPIFGDSKLHYLDSAASTQKPSVVIKRMTDYLSYEHANIHRGAYQLSAKATENYDLARKKVADFLKAGDVSSIIFTRGTTEGVNLIAHAYEENLNSGDAILLTLLEHHSNIVPWQLLAKRKKLNLAYANLLDTAEIDLLDFKAKLKELRPKIVSFTYVANSFGTVTPVKEVIAAAKEAGSLVFIDAAQAVQHKAIDVTELDPDFLAFSGHKIYGPTGIGALYVSPRVQERLQPFQGGGDMIANVTTDGSEWAPFPQKFEAGTPAIAEAIALGSALDFVNQVGISEIVKHEERLFKEAFELLSKQPGVTLYGPATRHGPDSGLQASIIPFNLKGVHAHDLSTVADSVNVQIRAGHHCAIPALTRLGIPSSARASIGVYSDISDFEALVEAINKARKVFDV